MLACIFICKWIKMNTYKPILKKKKNNTWFVIDSYQRVWYLVFFLSLPLSLSLKGARKKGWNSSPENREFRECVMQHHSMQTLNYHRCNGESRSRQKLFTFFSPTFRYTYVFPLASPTRIVLFWRNNVRTMRLVGPRWIFLCSPSAWSLSFSAPFAKTRPVTIWWKEQILSFNCSSDS